jgi:hypothetical protein
MGKLKKALFLASGIEGHRAMLRAAWSGEPASRRVGLWRRYLEACEAIVERWGGPWMRRRFLRRQRGVWLMALVFGLVTVGSAMVVYSSLLQGMGSVFHRPTRASGSSEVAGQR